MTHTVRLLLLAVAGVLVLAPAARADQLISAATGARNLAYGGGWRAWAAPAPGGRWQLMIRAPGGRTTAAAVQDFGAPPDASIGSTSFGAAKRFVAVYSRCQGTSATQGCDIFQYDLAAGSERKLTRLSTAAGSETAPSISVGAYAFVRRGGPRAGTYTAGKRVRRIDARIAQETAVTPSRVARRIGDTIVMSQFDGQHRRVITKGIRLFSVVLTRYRVGWLQHAGNRVVAFMTDRINPSGSVTIRAGTHDLPASTQSAVSDASRTAEYLDATGVNRADPPLF